VLQASQPPRSCGKSAGVCRRERLHTALRRTRFWYRSQFVAGGGCWGGYQNPSFEELLNTADLQHPSQAGDAYVRAGRLLVEDAAYIGLLYTKRAMLIKPYLKGAGFNAIYDDAWSDIEILKH
jgi:hypothetical protein